MRAVSRSRVWGAARRSGRHPHPCGEQHHWGDGEEGTGCSVSPFVSERKGVTEGVSVLCVCVCVVQEIKVNQEKWEACIYLKKAASTGKQEAVQGEKKKKRKKKQSVPDFHLWQDQQLRFVFFLLEDIFKRLRPFFFLLITVHPFHVTSGVDGLLAVLRVVKNRPSVCLWGFRKPSSRMERQLMTTGCPRGQRCTGSSGSSTWRTQWRLWRTARLQWLCKEDLTHISKFDCSPCFFFFFFFNHCDDDFKHLK